MYPTATVATDQMPVGHMFLGHSFPSLRHRFDQSSCSCVALKRAVFNLVFPLGKCPKVSLNPLLLCHVDICLLKTLDFLVRCLATLNNPNIAHYSVTEIITLNNLLIRSNLSNTYTSLYNV